MKKKKLIIWLVALLVGLFLIFGFIFVYCSSRYEALNNGIEVSKQATYLENNKYMVFEPRQEKDNSFSKTGIVFYPGAMVQLEAYAPMLKKFSDDGILVIAVRMPFDLAILGSKRADKAISYYPEIDNWYIGGHSLGGAMAGKYLSNNSDKFKGLFLLGAYSANDISDTNLSILSLYGEYDGVLNKKSYEKNKKNLPKDVTEIIIKGGNHSGYADYGPQKKDNEATISKTEQINFTVDSIENWIQK